MSSLQITDDNKKEEEEIEVIECPICYEEINPLKNCVTTECGHQFHCKCLMQNSATNGFSCPMCRSIMAEELEDSDSEGEYEDEEDEEDEAGEIDDNALTSFRMFHQQLAGDEVEEEALEELELELEEAADAEIEPRPCSTFIAEKLAAQGVTLEDLVKCLLIEHEEYEPESEVNDRYSDQMFGKFRQIISNYPRQQAAAVAAAQQAVQMPGRTEGQRHQSSRLRAEVEINIGCLQNRYRILEDDDDDDDDV
jgi:hypothetical protein